MQYMKNKHEKALNGGGEDALASEPGSSVTWQWVPWVLFLSLIYPWPGNRGNCSLEILMSKGKK